MQKSKICFEIDKEDRKYIFLCNPESSLGEIYDILQQMKKHVLSLMNQIDEKKKEEGE